MNEIIVGWCLGTGVVCFTLGMIVGAWIADISRDYYDRFY